MNRIIRIVSMASFAVLALATVVFAQEAGGGGGAGGAGTLTGGNALIEFGGAFGVGLTVIGAAYGISKLASSALESMARQPEVAGSIQTAMIIAAALIEGFTFYALYICSTAV